MDDEPIGRTFRLTQIQNLLYRNPRGLTCAELARLCGVSTRTIQRDIRDLGVPPANIPLRPEHGRWVLDPDYAPLLSALRLTLPEATALFLAARLLLRASDEANPYVGSALARLAAVLPEPMADHVRATMGAPRARAEDGAFVQVFSAITIGWAMRRKVRLWHRSGGSSNAHEYVLSPYFIEPSAPSYAAYVIGYEELFFKAVRTFKLERVQRAQVTAEPFSVPADFDIAAFLSSAWGIMGGDNQVEVVLRFAPEATRRVKESVWHGSQVIEDLAGGGCTLQVLVNHPLEMVPWIRGWAHQVEVLVPADLRSRVADEARQTARVYGAES
jgi:predicted DNA-binding transcriptional regulator YafY